MARGGGWLTSHKSWRVRPRGTGVSGGSVPSARSVTRMDFALLLSAISRPGH